MERVEPLSSPPSERRLYQFGEYRVDPVRRRILRDGEQIAVTSKSFSLLMVLLERRGEVVDKEELFRQVWPDTYVTEANLTQNVSSLRKALGERAGDRRFIVTVPGRGYSFVAEVMEIADDASSGIFPILRPEDVQGAVRPFPAPASPVAIVPAAPPAVALPLPAQEGTGETTAVSAVTVAAPVPSRWSRRPVLLLIGGIALLLTVVVAGVALLIRPRTAPAPPASPAVAPAAAGHRPTVAVLGFRDLAGRPETAWLGVALSEMLTTELAAGGQARLISGDNMTRARQSLAIPYTEAPRGPELDRLRTILGADVVIVGSYLSLEADEGRQIRLDLRAVKLPGGAIVATASEVGKESDLFEIVTRVGAQLRQAIGLNELSPGQTRALQALHPSEPEAAELAAKGLARLRAYDPMRARELLERAAEIEPGSASIHSTLARAWSDLGNDARALAEARRALDLAQSLPREERLAIEARFYSTGKQWAQAAEIYRSLWTFFPDELDHGLALATSLINAGRSNEALEVLATLRQSPLGMNDPRVDLEEARAARRVSDLATQARAAASAAEKAQRSGERLALARALIFEGDALLLTGQPNEAVPRFRKAEQLARAVGHTWTVGMAASNLANALQALGQLDEAEIRNEESLKVARQLGTAGGIAAQVYSLAMIHQDRGELDQALRQLREARASFIELGDRMMQGRVESNMAPVLLQQGDVTAARQMAENAVTAAREVKNWADEAHALEVEASILAWQGDLAGARRELELSLRLLLGLRQPSLASTVLASSAGVLARLGDVELAGRRLEQAAASEQRSGDKLAGGPVLSARSQLALRTGDVAQAQALATEMLRLARQTGARTYEAWALYDLGRAQSAAGNRAGARSSFELALEQSEETGDALRTALVRLELARLELAAGRNGKALELARAAAGWLAPRGFAGLEAESLAVVAEASLRVGRPADARAAWERIRGVAGSTQDRELALGLASSLARGDAAAGDVAGAARGLLGAITEAERLGFVPIAREARRVLGEISPGRPDRSPPKPPSAAPPPAPSTGRAGALPSPRHRSR